MAMDYPDAKDWSLYYAQSVSLTRFLVEQGPPEQFVQFVRDSQRDGIESALQSMYRIGGFAELQERWTEYARRQTNAIVREARREPKDQGPAAESNNEERRRPAPARRSPRRPGRPRSTRFGPIARSSSAR